MSSLSILQSNLKKNKIDIFIINRSDEFLNEYISPNAERLKFVTNFSGSAGKAIISPTDAFLYVDGRYTFQAEEQINQNEITSKHIKKFWDDFKKIILKNDYKVAIDVKLHSIKEIKYIQKLLSNTSSEIKYLEINPIDLIWKDQPKIKYSKIFDHPVKFSGEDRTRKLEKLIKYLEEKNIHHYLVTGLDNIAWLLNIRADDISHTPLVYAHLLVSVKEKHSLYFSQENIDDKLKSEIGNFINLFSIQNIKKIFSSINKNEVVGLDFSSSTYYFFNLLKKNNIKYKDCKNPCVFSKAIKNQTEQTGAINANIRDGVSITRYIYWLKKEMNINITNEISASQYLYNLRKENKFFHSLSFDTISAFGKNAALPHYRVNIKNNTNFSYDNIYLVDSGAQYYDGTTDITRTIVLGSPTTEQKDRFTRVLKGHISLSNHTFRKGITGTDIDYLARKSLNEIGCDYDHGTGHGIGSFLSVHEAPQRIAKKSMFDSVELLPGMILSNEPGYYKLDEYGIRIENLILVKQKSDDLLYFENLSWCPIDKDLIIKELLNKTEIEWLNKYHEKVFSILNIYLNDKEKKWLKIVTAPL